MTEATSVLCNAFGINDLLVKMGTEGWELLSVVLEDPMRLKYRLFFRRARREAEETDG